MIKRLVTLRSLSTFYRPSYLLQKQQQQHSQGPPDSNRGYGGQSNVEERVSDAYGRVKNTLKDKYVDEKDEMNKRYQASGENQGISSNVGEKIKKVAENVADTAFGTWTNVKEQGSEAFKGAKDKLGEMGQSVQNIGKDMKDDANFKMEKTGDKMGQFGEKADELKRNATKKAKETVNKMSENANEIKDKTSNMKKTATQESSKTDTKGKSRMGTQSKH
eukprot:NODE_231_length_13709_cov_0.444526.p6 type:complete len:219 gc:universal NODE_231_length_13709_cov_0.444526:4580-3924(-)